MSNVIVDIILVLVVFVGFMLGWRRGFVGIVARPVKFVASIGIAFGYASAFSGAVIMPLIEAPATNYVKDFLYRNITETTAADDLPTILKIAAAVFDIDLNSVTENAGGSVVDAIVEKMTLPVIETVSLVLAFIALLIIANIVIAIAIAIIKSIFKNGVLGVCNKILGIVFGLAFFFIIAWALAVILEFAIHLPALRDAAWVNDFDGGFIYKFLNEYNPLELLLSF